MHRMIGTVLLLCASNCFMTWAWYGHLKKAAWSIPFAILASWMIALPEYALQVPANRIGHVSQGGPFTAPQLKVIQEAIALAVFLVFSVKVLGERPRANELIAFGLVLVAVVVAMAGREGRPHDPRMADVPPRFSAPPAVAPPVET